MTRKRWNKSTKSFRKMVEANGWTLVRRTGGHSIYAKEGHRIVVNNKINPMVALRIIKENNLQDGNH